MDLDAFIQQAKADAKKPKKRKARAPDKSTDFERTKEYLRQLRLDSCIPVSVHLRINTQYCRCSARYTSINSTLLVKKEGNSLTHYEQITNAEDYPDLPRVLEERKTRIGHCPACFESTVHKKLWEGPAT